MVKKKKAPAPGAGAYVPGVVQPVDMSAEGLDKHHRIMDAALELFAIRGYPATAVPEIAKAAGVATGTIYRYFETKEDLLNTLYQRWRSHFNDSILAPAPDGLSVEGAFGLIWRRMIGWMRDYPLQTIFLEQHYLKPFLSDESREHDGVYIAGAEALVAMAIDTGDIRPMPPGLVTAMVWGTAVGMSKLEHSGNLVLDEAAISHAEKNLWNAIKA